MARRELYGCLSPGTPRLPPGRARGLGRRGVDLLQAKVLASAGGTDVDESANSSRPAVFHGRKPFGRDLKTAFCTTAAWRT